MPHDGETVIPGKSFRPFRIDKLFKVGYNDNISGMCFGRSRNFPKARCM